MALNHSITDAVSFHWLYLDALVILLLIPLRIVLLILSISDLVGFISQQVGFVSEVRFVVFQCCECVFVSYGVHPVIDA